MNFASDNATGVAPEIMQALAAANGGSAMAYGEDAVTERAQAALRALFECPEMAVFPVATGSAANALALSVLSPPYGVIYCHVHAHIQEDECGGPEFFSGGAKLALLEGADGKISAATLARALGAAHPGVVHHAQPAAVSITQATESGTVYSLEEVRAIAEVTHEAGLALHMDGARFANAVAALGCGPAEASWRAGVDVLSFGATKNGAMAAEAVLFFRPELARDFAFRRKRAGHLLSKMRFVSAQLEAYAADGLWLKHARHANAQAKALAEGLAALPGARLLHPVEANEVFVALPQAAIAALRRAGAQFHPWGPEEQGIVRLVTAYDTPPEAVARFIEVARGETGSAAGRRP